MAVTLTDAELGRALAVNDALATSLAPCGRRAGRAVRTGRTGPGPE